MEGRPDHGLRFWGMGSRRNRPPAGTGPLVRSPQRLQAPVLDLTDFKRDLSELTDRLGHAQDCL